MECNVLGKQGSQLKFPIKLETSKVPSSHSPPPLSPSYWNETQKMKRSKKKKKKETAKLVQIIFID